MNKNNLEKINNDRRLGCTNYLVNFSTILGNKATDYSKNSNHLQDPPPTTQNAQDSVRLSDQNDRPRSSLSMLNMLSSKDLNRFLPDSDYFASTFQRNLNIIDAGTTTSSIKQDTTPICRPKASIKFNVDLQY